MDAWKNENDNILRIRVTEAKFAKRFVNEGSIKFGTPKKWVQEAQKNGEGRGDSYEGTIAFCHFSDVDRIKILNEKYGAACALYKNIRNIHKEFYNQRLLYKDSHSMQLPCFCMYFLKNKDISLPISEGNQTLTAHIPGSYFKDFVNGMSSEEIERLPYEEKPALILIIDFDKFKERLISRLKSIGIRREEILISYVTYMDFEKYGDDGWMDFNSTFPNELFIKNIRFLNQSEGRIIINTKDETILKKLSKPIKLGNMSDIAKYKVGYFPDGTDVEINANIFAE